LICTIDLGIDTNGNGAISPSEAEEIPHMDVSDRGISNNIFLTVIRLRDMPSLNEVCVWVMPFPPDGVEVDMANSPNINFTTECSK
jgi:hypothetical protein